MIHFGYKTRGQTPLEWLNQERARLNIDPQLSATYAGRLDPLAEGVMLGLYGDSVHEKPGWLGKKKQYDITAIVGLATDTGDLLGMPSFCSCDAGSVADIMHAINTFSASYQQTVPWFSGVKVQGKPLHYWAKQSEDIKKDIVRPSKMVDIALDAPPVLKEIQWGSIHNQITQDLKIKGEFRQNAINQVWRSLASEQKFTKDTTFYTITWRVSVSAGTYIRTYINDIANVANSKLCLLKLVRTKIFN